MYYSSGNYEAFARPKKPVDVDKKSAKLGNKFAIKELELIKK